MKELSGAQVLVWTKKAAELAHVAEALSRRGCAVQMVTALEQVRRAVRERPVHLIVAQICPCCPEWKDLFYGEQKAGPLPPVLFVASDFDVDLYLEAMRRGAFDCISVPLNESELLRIAGHALAGQLETPSFGKGVQP